MKTPCLILLLLLSSGFLFAQSGEQRVAYFDEKWTRLPSEKGAAYYRTALPLGSIFIVRDYTLSGKLQMDAECSEYTPRLIYHGKMKRFFENGNLSEEGDYKDGNHVGDVIFYFENGKPKQRLEYADKKTLYKQIYTEDGRELLVNGRGVINDKDENGEIIYTLLKNYEYFSCYKLKSAKDTVFLTLAQMAEYPGGNQQLYADVGRSIRYPKKALKDGIEGIVYIGFDINKAGEVENVNVVKGIGGGCDEEAVRVISELKPWKPAIERGKIVKSRYVLPLKFGLTG
jgi:TonB family protein